MIPGYDRRTISVSDRAYILSRDNARCQYCGDHADAVDHIIPWSHSHSNAVFNLVASCSLCNSVASNKVFDTFLEKKNHILTRRLQMLSRRAIPIWFRNEIDELSGRLRQKIESDCIVVENYEEGVFIARRLAEDGFLVTFGNGDVMDAEQLLKESANTGFLKLKKESYSEKRCLYCGNNIKHERNSNINQKKYCGVKCCGKANRKRKLERDSLKNLRGDNGQNPLN